MKPPYRVPSMAEISEVRGSTGLRVVSTFSGCGGSCLGFEMAGFEVVYACEFIPEARKTYAANHPEIVMGLVRGVAKGYFKLICAALSECGYRLEARALDSQWLGVPQARQRIIFVGIRNDLPGEPAFPEPLPYRYGVRDAIGDLVDGQLPGSPLPSPEGDGPSFVGCAIHREWMRLLPGQTSDRYFNLVRPDFRKPVPTITGSAGSHAGTAGVAHPMQPRKFTVAELRRLSGFPDDFVLTGTFGQQWERIGRAVPPLMMAAVARSIVPVLRAAKAAA